MVSSFLIWQRALFALGHLGHYLLLGVLASGSLCPVSWCCRGVQHGFLGRFFQLLVRNTWFDSGYMFCISAWRLGATVHIFYGEVDLNPEVVFLRSLAKWRSVLSRCFSFQSGYAQLALRKLDTTSMSFT